MQCPTTLESPRFLMRALAPHFWGRMPRYKLPKIIENGPRELPECFCTIDCSIESPFGATTRSMTEARPQPSTAVGYASRSTIHLHGNNVIHGDLKPSNWLWGGRVLLICDFATARNDSFDYGWTSTRASTRAMLHSEGYTAPTVWHWPCPH